MGRINGTAQMVPARARNKHMNQFSPAGLIGRDVTQGENFHVDRIHQSGIC